MLRILFYPLIAATLAVGITEIIPIAEWLIAHPLKYQYVGMGMAGYVLLTFIGFFNKNLEWLRTFSHELSHTVVGMMFLRKIHSFEAGVGEGVMSHSGGFRFGTIFISLAPYCLPIFTYLLLFLRELGAANSLYIFDIMIGVVTAFHIGCFRRQIGLHQTDITSVGAFRSALFIVAMWIVNLSVLLLSIRVGVLEAFKRLAIDYFEDLQRWSKIAIDFAAAHLGF
ncbi:MAG: M50 family metallopeptidase [Alistipes sp.]|nr:M50 family metallopeptidase [Alistipes sp.]MBQ9962877.1 M50 family metallopeptidase [Alistipes sp.]